MNKQDKKQDLNQAINFLEEFIWLIDSKKEKGLELKKVPQLLRNLLDYNLCNLDLNHNLPKSNDSYLVGVLPSLFLDKELFKDRAEILKFAEEVLKIKLSIAKNRSQTEYIGEIVCKVTKLNEFELSSLVNALSKIIGDKNKMEMMRKAKQQVNFSWNETIQKLSRL